MVRDAETHAAEDRKRKESVETRNRGDQMKYEVEKNLKQHADKIAPATKSEVEAALEKLGEALKGQDDAGISAATQALEAAWHKAAAEIYKSTAGEAGPAPGGPAEGAGAEGAGGRKGKKGDGAVEADYEVMN